MDVNFGAFEAHSELRALSTRTKKLIFIDVPRTFAEFNDKSSAVRSFLKNTERYSALLLVLSRILCSACKMFSAEYKQGMNFAAGAVLLNCAMKANDQAGAQQANKSASPVSAITACFSDMGAHDASYYISFDTEVKAYFAVCQLLSSDSLLPLLKSSGQLFAQVKRFEYVVSRCPETTRVVSHLESLGTNLDFLSNQWLSTCFSVGIPHNLTVSIQELILNKTGREIFLKMGLCIIVILQARILQLKGRQNLIAFIANAVSKIDFLILIEVKSIVDEIKLMVSQLNIDEVMYYFSHFRVNPDSTGILELIEVTLFTTARSLGIIVIKLFT